MSTPSITAKIIKDSISKYTDIRLVTMELSYHRYIHSEFLTHRVFSRSASSSRAIPTKKLIEQVRDNPMMPIEWGKNKPGMQADEKLVGTKLSVAEYEWRKAAEYAADTAEIMLENDVHKQITNRLLEPFLPIKVIVTATEWDNFFNLRLHPTAQPEIQELARVMRVAMDNSTPTVLSAGQWHLPYIYENEEKTIPWDDLVKLSVARCARVSYLNHDGSNCTFEKDIELYNKLLVRPYKEFASNASTHESPAEHQASPKQDKSWSGNFRGWNQYRQML